MGREIRYFSFGAYGGGKNTETDLAEKKLMERENLEDLSLDG
jgi:hypothetical protein